MNLFQNDSKPFHNNQTNGILKIIKASFITAFYEIPSNKIYLKKDFGNIIRIILRFKIFTNMYW